MTPPLAANTHSTVPRPPAIAFEGPAPNLEPAPRRVLVKEVNWLGDLVMSLPALRSIRKAWPQAHLAVLVKKELAGFFAGCDWLNEVIPYSIRKGWRGFGDQRQLVAELKKREFDLSICFPNSFRSALWPAWAGVPKRAGFARDWRGPLLTHRVRPHKDILECHQVHYYQYMLRKSVGVNGAPEDCALTAHEPLRAKMKLWLQERRERPEGKLIALAVAAAYGPAKEWPPARYAALIDLLAEKYDAECVLVGAPSERIKCEQVAAESKVGAMLAAGETQVGEAIAMLSLCDAFAGNDSGSMHVAGALGIPTVGIFGSTRADRTGPLGPKTRILYKKLECSPCLERTCRFGHYDCLKQIEPSHVLAALNELGVFA